MKKENEIGDDMTKITTSRRISKKMIKISTIKTREEPSMLPHLLISSSKKIKGQVKGFNASKAWDSIR